MGIFAYAVAVWWIIDREWNAFNVVINFYPQKDLTMPVIY